MATWKDVVRIGTKLPAVGESTSYRTPSLKLIPAYTDSQAP